MSDAKRDQNSITTLLAVSNVDGETPVVLWADPTTHRLLVDLPAGAGDVSGPGSATDNAIVRFDGATGNIIQNSGVIISDADGMSNVSSLAFNTSAAVSVSQAEFAWNADEETMDLGLNGAILQLGQETHYHVRNNTGVQIDNGTPVMATGTIGASGRITIGKMDGSNIANAKFFLGIATEDIADGTDGKVTSFGKVRDMDTSSWNEGDVLWVDNATTGTLTNAQPTTGTRLPIAFVVTKHAVNGAIAVRSTDGTYLSESHDSSIVSPVSGEYLGHDGTEWINKKIQASEVGIALGVGSPTIDQVQEYFDNTGSSGFFLGGEITDGGAGTIDVAAGSGFIRTTNNDNAELQSFKWSASAGLAVADNTTQYVYVDDTGAISLNTDEFLETPDLIQIGVATDEGGVIVNTFSLGVKLAESIGQAGRFIRRVHGITRDQRKGGLIMGQSGDANRDINVSAGVIWWGRTEYPFSSFDTSGVDTFETYSASGQESAVASQFPNEQFDNAGTLTTLTNNRWANLFFFLIPNNGVIMVYGRDEFTSQALAEGEGVPSSSLPTKISETGLLISRFTFQKSSNVAVISSAFDTLFANAGVTDHSNLSSLGWTSSNHSGTASTFAGFDGSGLPIFYTEANYLLADGSRAYTSQVITDNAIATIDSTSVVNGEFARFTANGLESRSNAEVKTQLGYITDVVDDASPELGGELDAGAHSIGFTMQTATGDGATTVDWKLGNHMDFTFGAFNEVFTFTAPSNPGVYTMSLKQDSVGSRTATFPATVKWAGGTAPTLTTTLTTGYDVLAFRFDGTNFYSTASLDFS